MRLAEKREYFAPGERVDHLGVTDFHHPLEVAAHLEHGSGSPPSIIVRSIAVNPSESTHTIRLSST
jgi:hypothetical protein